jgi:regulator of protease activity HflC (stomatin/prohibitin superfamily)
MGFVLAFLFLFIVVAAMIVLVKTVRIVPQATVLVIERLGAFSRLADSGLHILWPFFDRPARSTGRASGRA